MADPKKPAEDFAELVGIPPELVAAARAEQEALDAPPPALIAPEPAPDVPRDFISGTLPARAKRWSNELLLGSDAAEALESSGDYLRDVRSQSQKVLAGRSPQQAGIDSLLGLAAGEMYGDTPLGRAVQSKIAPEATPAGLAPETPTGTPRALAPMAGASPTGRTGGGPGSGGGSVSVSSSRTGPADPGATDNAIEDLIELDNRAQAALEHAGGGYEKQSLYDEGKLLDPDAEEPGGAPTYRAGLVEEFQALAGQGKRSDAENARMTEIVHELSVDTAGAKASEQIESENAKARDLARQAETEAAANLKYQEKAQAALSDLDTLMEDYDQKQIDPGRLLGSAGKRIGAALAVALGSFGSALTGTPNAALATISQAIDRDISAQESDLRKAGTAIAQQKSLIGQMRQQYGDEGIARSAARVVMNKAASDRLTRINLEFAPQEKRDKAAGLQAGLAAKSEADRRDLEQKVIKGEQQRASIRGTLGSQQEQRDLALKMAAARRMSKGKTRDSWPGGFEPVEGKSPSKEQIKGAQALAEGYADVRVLLNEALALRRKYGNDLTPTAREYGSVIAGQLTLAMGKMNGAGASFTPAEMELMGTPENIVEVGFVWAKLDKLSKITDLRTDARANALNFQRLVKAKRD